MSDDIDLASTIKPNSDQLNAVELVAGPIIVTVEGLTRGPSEKQPINVHISGGHQPYRPNLGMRVVLITCWGDEKESWIGKKIELYRDPDVTWAGEAVGGIKVSAVSGIDKPIKIPIRKNRKQIYLHTVNPLIDAPQAIYPQDRFQANIDVWVRAVVGGALTVPQIISRANNTGTLTSEQLSELESKVLEAQAQTETTD